MPGQEFSAGLDGILRRHFQPAAAGHFHPHDSDTADIVCFDDGRQFLGIISFVQLRASDEGDPTPDEFLMEVCISESRTIRRDEKVCPLEIRRCQRHQLDLDGPLRKFAAVHVPAAVSSSTARAACHRTCTVSRHTTSGHRTCHAICCSSVPGMQHPGRSTGASPCRGCHPFIFQALFDLFQHILAIFYRFLIEIRRFPLLNGDGTGWTGRQAVAQTVAVILFQKHRLAIDHADGPLVAG